MAGDFLVGKVAWLVNQQGAGERDCFGAYDDDLLELIRLDIPIPISIEEPESLTKSLSLKSLDELSEFRVCFREREREVKNEFWSASGPLPELNSTQ